jgi:hypothetical protein
MGLGGKIKDVAKQPFDKEFRPQNSRATSVQLKAWESYRHKNPTCDSWGICFSQKSCGVGASWSNKLWSQGRLFSRLSSFLLLLFEVEIYIQCMLYHCILEAHKLFDFMSLQMNREFASR